MSPYPRKQEGGFSKKKFGFRGGDKPMAFDATCDVCHKPCRVPFKPNGSKPVLCTNCFKKDRGAESTYSGKRSFAGRDERIPGAFGRSKPAGYGSPVRSAAPADSGKLEARLTAIEAKIDRILKMLDNSELGME